MNRDSLTAECIGGKLHVQVLALAFKPDREMEQTFRVARSLEPGALCCAIVGKEAAEQVRSSWVDSVEGRLLLIHCRPGSSLATALEVINTVPSGPLAVLLAGPPSDSSLKSLFSRKSATELRSRIESARSDIQVHVYESSWIQRQPRIR